MSLYLYGAIAQSESVDFGAIGFGGGVVKTIPMGNLSAVVGSAPRAEFTKIPKGEIIRLLLAHQRTLETVMATHFVLPFKFGTMVKDEIELERIVCEGKGFLADLFEKVRDSVEIDVVASWEVRTILQEIAEEDPEIIACKQEMARTNQDRGAVENVGMLLAQALKKRADGWRQEIMKSLESHAKSHAGHDLLDDAMVLNSSFLIRKGGEEKFHHALGELNLHFKERLHFKCIGPLPPYSFATIMLRRFGSEEIQGAAKTLGLNGRAELAQVKKVYKALSRKCHPDTDPNLSVEKFEELNRAYETLADYCKDGPRPLAGEAIEKQVQLKVMENPHAA